MTEPTSDRRPGLVRDWRSSSFNGATSCLQTRIFDNGDVHVRDSKDPDGPILRFTASEWSAFLAGVVAGEFDQP